MKTLTSKDTLLLDLFEQAYVLESLAGPRTRSHMRSSINGFGLFLGVEPRVRDLSEENINRFLRSMLDNARSLYTLRQRKCDLASLWNFAWRKKILDDLPRGLMKIRLPHRLPKAWSQEEMQKILDACDHPAMGRTWPNGIPRGAWFKALVNLIYDTGLRAGDALDVRIDQIGPDGRFTVVQHKTGDELPCRLRPSTMDAIQAIFPPDRAKIFEGPKDRRRVITHYSKLVRLAGLPAGPRNGLQKLRRTAASHLESIAKGSASYFLGHRDMNMARRHYIDVTIVSQYTPLPPPISGNAADNVPIPKVPMVEAPLQQPPGLPQKKKPSFKLFTLRRYLEQHYLPEMMGGKSIRTVERIRWAINRLNDWAGRSLQVYEVKDDVLTRFVQDKVAAGGEVETYRRYRHLLTKLVTHAATRQADPEGDPGDLLTYTLRWYFEQFYLREVLLDHPATTRWQYQTAISQFDQYCERCLTVLEITDDLLVGFYNHTVRRGCKESSARKYLKQIKAIVRHAQRRAMNMDGGEI